MLIHDKKVYIVYNLNGLKTFDLWVNNVGFWTHKKNRQIVVFFENGGAHKNDNYILVGNKLIVTW